MRADRGLAGTGARKTHFHLVDMNGEAKIISLDSGNVSEYSPTWFLNPKNEGYQRKLEWLQGRFSEGLRIKLLYLEQERKSNGFIEYVPGEYAWRAVDAAGYMFIHCICISPNKYKSKGYGSLLVEACVEDARNEGAYGVAVVTSEGPFMAGKALFARNGFESVAKVKPSYELMVKTLKEGPLPTFRDWETQLGNYEGLNIIYAEQCPWVARSITELDEVAKRKGLEVKITELKSAEQARAAPSAYGTFSLVYDDRLLVDHYISSTRFTNIVEKELQSI